MSCELSDPERQRAGIAENRIAYANSGSDQPNAGEPN
jgi:hypothetical protein